MTNDNKLQSTVKKVASKIMSLPKKLTEKFKSIAGSITKSDSATTAAKYTEHSNIEHSTEQKSEPNLSDRVRIRLIPVWLRVILVLCLLIMVIVFGLMFGYAVLGDGNASDVLKWSTWQHIIDIMKGVE
ncbi:MAG: DNA-directed RNA polymerase subunit beta [Lysinibacillus sp.]